MKRVHAALSHARSNVAALRQQHGQDAQIFAYSASPPDAEGFPGITKVVQAHKFGDIEDADHQALLESFDPAIDVIVDPPAEAHVNVRMFFGNLKEKLEAVA